MSVSPTDWQCCNPTPSGLRCTKPLIYGSHDGPCVHEHNFERYGDDWETGCGCPDMRPALEARARAARLDPVHDDRPPMLEFVYSGSTDWSPEHLAAFQRQWDALEGNVRTLHMRTFERAPGAKP